MQELRFSENKFISFNHFIYMITCGYISFKEMVTGSVDFISFKNIFILIVK